MTKMSDLASSINGSSAALTLGEGVDGVLVRETEPDDVTEVLFAYMSPNASINVGALRLSTCIVTVKMCF